MIDPRQVALKRSCVDVLDGQNRVVFGSPRRQATSQISRQALAQCAAVSVGADRHDAEIKKRRNSASVRLRAIVI